MMKGVKLNLDPGYLLAPQPKMIAMHFLTLVLWLAMAEAQMNYQSLSRVKRAGGQPQFCEPPPSWQLRHPIPVQTKVLIDRYAVAMAGGKHLAKRRVLKALRRANRLLRKNRRVKYKLVVPEKDGYDYETMPSSGSAKVDLHQVHRDMVTRHGAATMNEAIGVRHVILFTGMERSRLAGDFLGMAYTHSLCTKYSQVLASTF